MNLGLVNLFITYRCSLLCRHCFLAAETGGPSMTREDFDNIISKLINHNLKNVKVVGGEVFDNPALLFYVLEKLSTIKGIGLKVQTNGLTHFFSEKEIDQTLEKIAAYNINELEISGNGPYQREKRISSEEWFERFDLLQNNYAKFKITVSSGKNQSEFVTPIRRARKEVSKKYWRNIQKESVRTQGGEKLFVCSGVEPADCINIDPFGLVYTCKSMVMPRGSLLCTDLEEIFSERSEEFQIMCTKGPRGLAEKYGVPKIDPSINSLGVCGFHEYVRSDILNVKYGVLR